MTFWEWQLSADNPGGIIQSYILCVTVLAVLSRQTNSSLILHTLDLHLEICLMDPLPRLFSRITILLLKEICDTCKIWGLCILVSTRQLCIWGYSKTRLQIIRWNKSREASTENEEKQKGLNVGKRTTWYDRSLTTIILYSMTNLSHPSYYTKQKGQTEKDWTSEKQWQGMAGLSHPR